MYFVAFKLKDDINTRTDLIEGIKTLGNWSNRLDSVWLVESNMSSVQLRDLLKPYLQSGERLFVGEMTRNWAGTGMGSGFPEWLKRRSFRNVVNSSN